MLLEISGEVTPERMKGRSQSKNNTQLPLRPLRGLQETRVATREESGVLGLPSRRGLTPRGSLECNPEGGGAGCAGRGMWALGGASPGKGVKGSPWGQEGLAVLTDASVGLPLGPR